MRNTLSLKTRSIRLPRRLYLYALLPALFMAFSGKVYLNGYEAGKDDCYGMSCAEYMAVVAVGNKAPATKKHQTLSTLMDGLDK